ncbi:GlxA family transcriptional regulator [Vibrio sp. Vb0587]|uniref:GlxA family transcriptional regulator n=1 Tax=Vibrio sp. Vb0587 TaxID=3074626 RepID=UPI002964F40C|nr:helix-turn-helix domain-containing protein [Vibrio sp. Vb0587]MDW1964451.1 helix-turn-helix domain-containing protein [Vibrio sp. Vb0587]
MLAKAGLLKNKTCTVHWESANSLAEEFPNINVTSELYEFDPRTPTCSGGLAGLDMMLHLITNQHGSDLANQVAEQCIHPAIRPAHDKQRMSLIRKHNIRHPRLIDAVEIMEANMEEPLKCYEIGEQVGLSVRQMERLFLQYLQDKPGNYYLQLRLERAQHLLLQTMLSITQISTACGFSSTSYFARCYKKRYEKTPREERRLA